MTIKHMSARPGAPDSLIELPGLHAPAHGLGSHPPPPPLSPFRVPDWEVMTFSLLLVTK